MSAVWKSVKIAGWRRKRVASKRTDGSPALRARRNRSAALATWVEHEADADAAEARCSTAFSCGPSELEARLRDGEDQRVGRSASVGVEQCARTARARRLSCSVAWVSGTKRRIGWPRGLGAAGDDDGFVERQFLDLADQVVAAAARHEIGGIGEFAVDPASGAARGRSRTGRRCGSVTTGSMWKIRRFSSSACFRSSASGSPARGRRRRRRHGIPARCGCPACRWGLSSRRRASSNSLTALGDLADNGAEHRDIGLDAFEPAARIGIGRGR